MKRTATTTIKLPAYAKRALARVRAGAVLFRMLSGTDLAKRRGDGYLYFTYPDNRPVSPGAGRKLIRSGAVVPQHDGLFDGQSQTFIFNRSAEIKG